ncbi:hypothetical protein KCU78_g2735, partial [Aureobasidium melanogenum]
MSNSQPGDKVSAADVDTLLPPDYSNLEYEPEIPQASSDQDWKHIPGRSQPYKNYWTRIIKNDDETWHQYGISQHATNGKPEFYFTCKNMPRKKGKEGAIQRACKLIASAMRAHRSDDNYYRCTCDFETLRQPGG